MAVLVSGKQANLERGGNFIVRKKVRKHLKSEVPQRLKPVVFPPLIAGINACATGFPSFSANANGRSLRHFRRALQDPPTKPTS
jgi:hypothetical protein